MNLLKNTIIILILSVLASSCKKEDQSLTVLDNVQAPSNIKATFDITQDNTGLVTILATADGVTEFQVLFGDKPDEEPSKFAANKKITHVYSEGVYNVEIVAVGITGLTDKFTQKIDVTFRAPENLVVTTEIETTNPTLHVTADADFATVIDIYFGDQLEEVPVHILPGEETSHTYEEPGDYELKVIAKSGGAATTEYTDTITIFDPLTLPIDFESSTVNYAFTDFGNLASSVVNNPDASGINTSAHVAQSIKPTGAETWAGTYLTLASPIDFTTNNIFKIKVLSPKVGCTVKLKIENLTNGDIYYSVDAVTTAADEWEELSFDFSLVDLEEEYQKIVLFFDFGNSGDDTEYHFDDIILTN